MFNHAITALKADTVWQVLKIHMYDIVSDHTDKLATAHIHVGNKNVATPPTDVLDTVAETIVTTFEIYTARNC